MIFKLVQTKRAPNPEFAALSITNNNRVGLVQMPVDRLKMELTFSILGVEGDMKLGYDKTSDNNEKVSLREKLKRAFTFVITDKIGKQIGTIAGEMKNAKKFGIFGIGYPYQEINTTDKKYTAYEIGLGRTGEHYWTMYENDKIVGMIQKVPITINTYDMYDIYCEDEKIAFWLFLLSLEIDVASYENFHDQMGAMKTKESYNSIFMPKELKDKYDPTYIPRIKKLDGIE